MPVTKDDNQNLQQTTKAWEQKLGSFFGKLEHIKAVIYTGKFRKPCTYPEDNEYSEKA